MFTLSFIFSVQYLFSVPSVTCFFSAFLSQDSLEKFLGVNNNGGKTQYPEFSNTTEALRVIKLISENVPWGNCRGGKASIDWEA